VVQLLGLDHFDLAKELLRNRLKVVWVTRLRQAQDEAEVRQQLKLAGAGGRDGARATS
jgi:pre-mRNA-splicing helicase BRR2